MPEYTISLSKKAVKQLDKLPDNVAKSIIGALDDLSIDPRPNGNKKLNGREGCRIRIGDYRVIYEIFDYILLVEVISLGHRKDMYS